MTTVGIGTPIDVGMWICKQLKEELHMTEAASKLDEYFKKSSRNLKC